MLSEFNSSNLHRDWICWTGSGDGKLSTKSLGDKITQTVQTNLDWRKLIWRDVAPPKVELFVWLVIRLRIPVRVELLKRGLTAIGEDICPLCGIFPESAYHLLFNCDLVWNVWKEFAAFWGIHTVFLGNPGSFLEAWFEECLIKSLNSTWQFIPFVVFWTIWLYRNDVVFNKNIPDSSQIFSLAKIRLAKWFKAKFPLMAVSVDDLVANPSIADFLDKNRVTPVVIVAWEAPPLGYLKLNVDGAMLRDGSKGGIGGIFKNGEGWCIASFYESVGQGCPILTELLAVKYGLDNFLGLSVDSNMRLIVECDSKVAVDWILNPERCQSLFLPLVHNIQSLLLRYRTFLKHIPRGANIEADILAKKGIW
ncbi:hypothetical protein V6N11_016529 [Hibiscus sabdariffa]